MRFSSLLAVAGLGAVAAAQQLDDFDNFDETYNELEARQYDGTFHGTCSSGVHVIAIGGANSSDPYSYGLLISLAQGIVNSIPGSDMVSSPYPKQNLSAYGIQVGNGAFQQEVNSYHAACPDGKIVIVGYSAGAIIAMNGLCAGELDQGLAQSTSKS